MRATFCSFSTFLMIACVSAQEQSVPPTPASTREPQPEVYHGQGLRLYDPAAVKDDADRDGVRDAKDNCLQTANPDQADDDKDGGGNVCDAFTRPSLRPMTYWNSAQKKDDTPSTLRLATPMGEFVLHKHEKIVVKIATPNNKEINTFQESCREEKKQADCLLTDVFTAGTSVVFVFMRGAYVHDTQNGLTQYKRFDSSHFAFSVLPTPYGVIVAYAVAGFSEPDFGGFYFFDGNTWLHYHGAASYLDPKGAEVIGVEPASGAIYLRVHDHALVVDLDEVDEEAVGNAKIVHRVPSELVVGS